jgi:RNA polymerase sigma factor (sigma-70 family)
MRKPRYGELQASANPEAYVIWNSRDEELPPMPEESGFSEAESMEAQISARQAWRFIEAHMKDRHQAVLIMRHVVGLSADEIAKECNLSAGRVQQIEEAAKRKAKSLCAEAGIRLHS